MITIKKQTVYISANGEQEFTVCTYGMTDWIPEEPVIQVEAYVFTQEQLEKLLQDYTDKIVEEVELDTDSAYNVIVNKKSIRSQLPEFLKEIGF